MSTAQTLGSAAQAGLEADAEDEGMTLGEMAAALRDRLMLLTVGPLAAGALALGATFLIAPTFTAEIGRAHV